MKNIIIKIFSLIVFITTLNAIDKDQCKLKGNNFIFAGGECIQFHEALGDRKGILTIVVHGTWKEGSNTLGRYAPFADELAMQTDITTIAIALPGYSNSSTNNFPALSHKGVKHLASNKNYIEFLGDLIIKLKNKYDAKIVNYIGHSAGAAMGATLSGYKPNLINFMVAAGGYYDIHKRSKNKDLISLIDFINNKDIKTKYLLVYGTEDKISKPDITIDFYKIAKHKGMDVTLIEVEDYGHLDLDMSETTVDAIVDSLEEE